MTISLPLHDSPSLGLAHPTKAELVAHSRLNGVEWRGALSSEAYLRREEHLASQPLTKRSGITYWVLVDLSLQPDQRIILAGCETYRKRALVANAGLVKDVIAHGIGSVFTPPQYRGRRYAARMLRDLAVTLRTYQAAESPCLFSVLYSDIGRTFYAKLGWQPFQSSHIHLPPASHKTPSTPSVTLLQAEDLANLCAKDEDLLRRRLVTATKSGRQTALALCPDQKTLAWHHAREEFVTGEVLKRHPTLKGALINIDGGRRAWIIWTRMYYNADVSKAEGNTLHILRLAFDDGEDGNPNPSGPIVVAVRRLLEAAQEQAQNWNAEAVELWNPHPVALVAAREIEPSTEVVEREEDSIASLHWFGSSDADPMVWLINEKYAWC